MAEFLVFGIIDNLLMQNPSKQLENPLHRWLSNRRFYGEQKKRSSHESVHTFYVLIAMRQSQIDKIHRIAFDIIDGPSTRQ